MVQDNRDIQLKRVLMENARLTNELRRVREYCGILEREKARILDEQNGASERMAELEGLLLLNDSLVSELRESTSSLEKMVAEQEKEIESLRECLQLSRANGIDLQSIIDIMRNRQFNTNSDATRFINGQIDVLDPTLNTVGLEDLAEALQRRLTEAMREVDAQSQKSRPKEKFEKAVAIKTASKPSVKIKRPRHRYAKNDIERFGIDTSNLPEGAKIIHRKDSATGEDVWEVWTLGVVPGSVQGRRYEIGRFNIPGDDPMCSKKPETVVENCPLLPSFVRFYLVNKFELNMSEQNILRMFKEMNADIPQQTLNNWMHKVIKRMRDYLERPLQERLRQSTYTQNDETRLSVRSWNKVLGRYEYHTEYVHAMLSPEKRLVYMIYKEGSRSHEIQKEIIQGSNIRTITCDRASIYRAIEGSLEEYGLIRSSCWFHARHYLTDAYLTDHRMGSIIGALNGLFRIEHLIVGGTASERLEARRKYSLPLVDKLMTLLRKIRLNSSRYGSPVMKAVNYILDDEVAFRRFLDDGHVEMHNIAAERMFRHIAMGRRNWMHVGSHGAAENISFVYSLLESCKLNDLSFGDYVEDICTRMMRGEKDFESLLPCDYKDSKAAGSEQAVA